MTVKAEQKIVLISCYFGPLPWFFQYFVHSCKYNPSINFVIIADDPTYAGLLPANVKIIYKTLTEFSKTASDRFGFIVNIEHAYKMCDFKPAYGFVFPELLLGYNFWGHIDIDIIFGNIRAFMTDELLTNHDLICVRKDWLTGCFLLFKNTPQMNTLFMQSKDYQTIFTTTQHCCFDETCWAHLAFSEGLPYTEIHTPMESMMHVVKKLEAVGAIKPYFEQYIIEGQPGRLKWLDGKMTFMNQFEVLFYHLIHFKKMPQKKTRIEVMPNYFTISPTKIYHKRLPG